MHIGAVTLFIRTVAWGLHARFALMHIGAVTLFIRTAPTIHTVISIQIRQHGVE